MQPLSRPLLDEAARAVASREHVLVCLDRFFIGIIKFTMKESGPAGLKYCH
jgi:hypothetical protein